MTHSFENYSLDELKEALSTIDRAQYPDRLEELQRLLQLRTLEFSGGGAVAGAGERKLMADWKFATVDRLSAGTIFRLTFFGFSISMFVFIVLMGIGGALGFDLVSLNDQQVYGLRALKVAGQLALIIPPVFGLFGFLFVYLGLRVYAFFRPIQLQVIVREPKNEQ